MRLRYKLIAATTVVAVLLVGIGYLYFYYQEKPESKTLLNSLPIVPNQTRLLVFAPHCDDEALGCGGIIHDVQQAGGQVLVVIMTNGDGFTFATEQQSHRLLLTSQDYIQSGYARQNESLHALQLLGLPESQVLFLGYPDRGLNNMWSEHWDTNKPFRSRYTGTDYSPYFNSYQQNAPYAGQAVLANIEKIMLEFQPTLILLPHPSDEHPDHAATWAFVAATVAKLGNSGILPGPKIYTYLIHRGDFPIPHGYRPELLLLPPRPLYQMHFSNWYTYPINSDIQTLKEQSIREYVSQTRVPVMSGLLDSFIRKNELFAEVQIPVVEHRSLDVDLTNLDAWLSRAPIILNPPGVNLLGTLERRAKVIAVYSYIQGTTLWLRFHIPEFSSKQYQYHVSLAEFRLQDNNPLNRKKRAIFFSTLGSDVPPGDIISGTDNVIIKIPFFQQDVPDFFFIQVVTKDKLGASIDHTVWQPAFVQHEASQ